MEDTSLNCQVTISEEEMSTCKKSGSGKNEKGGGFLLSYRPSLCRQVHCSGLQPHSAVPGGRCACWECRANAHVYLFQQRAYLISSFPLKCSQPWEIFVCMVSWFLFNKFAFEFLPHFLLCLILLRLYRLSIFVFFVLFSNYLYLFLKIWCFLEQNEVKTNEVIALKHHLCESSKGQGIIIHLQVKQVLKQ